MLKLILCAFSALLFFPSALSADPILVCIFQTAPRLPGETSPAQVNPGQPLADASDAATLAPMLSVAAGPNALTAIPVAGVAAKEMDGEAAKHGCAWIVELARGHEKSAELPFDRDAKGGPAGGPIFAPSPTAITSHIEYSIRKPGVRKSSGRGSSNKPDWAALFPAEILAKIAAAP